MATQKEIKEWGEALCARAVGEAAGPISKGTTEKSSAYHAGILASQQGKARRKQPAPERDC